MNFSVFLEKELKIMQFKRAILIFVLLIGMLGVFFLGQLGGLKNQFNLEVSGPLPLIRYLLSHDETITECGNLLFATGFFWPMVLSIIYIGFPYVLGSYEKAKTEGTLTHLLLMPVRTKRLVFFYAVFSYLRLLFTAVCVFLITALPLIIINPQIIVYSFNGNLFFFINAVGAGFLMLVTALVWIFNGSRIIMNIMRFIFMGLLVGIMPLIYKVEFKFTFSPLVSVAIAVPLLILGFVAIFLTDYFVDKERITLSLSE